MAALRAKAAGISRRNTEQAGMGNPMTSDAAVPLFL
jgi:hypothetical protein